jgi:hypothetical protein
MNSYITALDFGYSLAAGSERLLGLDKASTAPVGTYVILYTY